MSLQRNVDQQNAEALAEIKRVAGLLKAGSAYVAWLPGLLAEQGLPVDKGLLVRLSSVPEQEGDMYYGTWLAVAAQFWEFVAVVSRETGAVLELESFLEATDLNPVNEHVRGTGKSFGHLAVQVFRELNGA